VEVKLKYGNRHQFIHIPENTNYSIFSAATLPILEDPPVALENALAHPIGCQAFEDLVRTVRPKKVSIAVPDETRPVPIKMILPVLLRRLTAALGGFNPAAVTVVIGGGLHPPLKSEAFSRILPAAIFEQCRVLAHDAVHSRMMDFGITRRGTPVRINAEFAEANFKIAIGQIDPHQFVGFTGGAKGVSIGCAAPESIEHNHSLMFDPKAQVGVLEGNPVREDMNEAGEMIGIDLAINVVLNADKKVARFLAGAPGAVLKKGAKICAQIYGVEIDRKFDFVIASCGGYPKDISLYQAQKGLNLASQALKRGGKILLLAACPQGVGDDIYFDYVCRFTTPKEVLKDFQRLKFKMGAHKAYLFSRTLVNYDVAIVSDLTPDILKQCHLRAADPSVVITDWLEAFEGRPSLAIVPDANTTYFYHKQPI
jgi:nickel-dependent lactate racemase